MKALPPQASSGEPIRLPRAKPSRTPPTELAAKSSDSTPLLPTDARRLPPKPKETVNRSRPRQIEDDPTPLGISAEHLQTAARQFKHGEEARVNGNIDYATQLLLSCTKFNPASVVYRHSGARGR